MGKIIAEHEVCLSLISEFLEESGWNIEQNEDRLMLHSLRGFGFSICLDQARSFLVFNSYFQMQDTFEDHSSLANKLNDVVFLASFWVDDEGGLSIAYPMSYERGLILAQLSRVTMRFSSMLAHIVDKFDANGEVFQFERELEPSVTGPTTLQ